MATCDATLMFLHEAFVTFSEVLTNEGSNWEACKLKLQQLQDQWHQKGLSGAKALNVITQYQSQIKWQDMPPDHFNRFYRFVFHICREPGKRNIQMDVAVAAWRLVLPGRFRLLERWCTFTAASSAVVVTQDLWRQVLDFSRTVHEDLSNFDSAGSWAVLLDEFVEEMRTSRRRSYTSAPDGGAGASNDRLARQASSGTDLAALFTSAAAAGGHSGFGAVGGDGDGGDAMGCPSFMASISPRCGSKRRGPDVDVVAEQLSAMPLGAGQHHPGTAGGHGHGQGPAGLPPVRPCGQPQAQASSAYGYSLGTMPYGGTGSYHRGSSSPDGMAKRPCLDRHPQYPQQQQQQAQQQMYSLGKVGYVGGGGEGAPGFMCTVGGGGAGVSGTGGRTPSGGQPMSCSTGSLDSDSSQGGPAGSAGMDYWLPECAGMSTSMSMQEQQQQQLCQPQHCQQRRAIKARRSGLSDIVKSAVTDALGF
ncbi:hypothetical protein PLESTB_000900200 [Pleodorina starrii]|uniref:Defective in cullin neddylation protein n=1 Tax=Pleodorina starrii TaxID=330485 RepID=A0A9W6BM17_9CHLO|nr:hypothetical protein PLESTM_001563800 [Pleodorina starrii]GLC54731.1 hypothetical protein PLESTB_000900200 [Pleodorina starrii]GLC68333.1 hypothetical protein PLESTF_000680100 [Pleodorina starrii]